MKSVIRTGGQIKVWITGITLGLERPTLSILIPLREDHPVSKTMLHRVTALNKDLHDVQTSHNYKSIFPDSHTFARLALLALIREGEDGTFCFNDLYSLVKEELHYIEEEKSKRITEDILKLGKDLKFIEDYLYHTNQTNGNNRFKMISKSKKAESRERELKKKWIEFEIEKDKENESTKELEKLQYQFMEKRKKEKTIMEYLSDISQNDNNGKQSYKSHL